MTLCLRINQSIIMDPLIVYYLEHTFSPEQLEDLLSSFALMETFELPHYQQKYIDLISNSEHMSSAIVQDTFYSLVRTDTIDILKRHGVKTTDYATLAQLIEIATSLAILQNLENPEPVLITLEGLEDDTTKIFRIISDYTVMSEFDLYTVIESVEPKLLQAIKQVCISLENANEDSKEVNQTVHIELLKMLSEYCKDSVITPVGIELVKTGFKVGYRFSDYIGSIRGTNVEKTYEDVAKDVYSLLVISSDGIAAPLVIFKKYSDQLFDSFSVAMEVERHLTAFIKNFQEYTESVRAQNSVS